MASHIALEELSCQYEACRVVITDQEHRLPEYLAVNPRARVPTLVIDDGEGERTLTESIAILVYLSRRYPEAGLLPSPDEARGEPFARALEWMAWLAANVHQATTRAVIRPSSFAESSEAQREVQQCAKSRMRSAYDDIENLLRGRVWSLGARYSLVDAYLLVFFRWGGKCGLSMRKEYPEFTRVMDAVRDRKAVRKVVEVQGITLE